MKLPPELSAQAVVFLLQAQMPCMQGLFYK